MAIWSGADTVRQKPSGANSPPAVDGLFFGRCRIRLGLQHLLAAIKSIAGNAMPRMGLAALGVDRHRGCRERRVGAMHAALRRGLSAFLNCHECCVLSSFLQQILQYAQTAVFVTHVPVVRAARRGHSSAARCRPPRAARPTTILPRPVRASDTKPRPSRTSRAASPAHPGLTPFANSISLLARDRKCEALQTTLTNQLRTRLHRHASRPHAPTPPSQMRISPHRPARHPPKSPVSEALAERVDALQHHRIRRPGARNRLGQASPVPWAAYNRARFPPLSK